MTTISSSSRLRPQYPIYIPTKGRWEWPMTIRTLDSMGVPYRLIVEESEYKHYREITDQPVLVLDPHYKRTYETCDEHGLSKSTGSGPARNFAWDHSISLGADAHWVVDDNIRRWMRFHRNLKISFADASPFWLMEHFTDRYENVLLAAPHYEMFVHRRQLTTPYLFNSRVMSCILIRNSAPFRWRGRYNEDIDLSLRVLKAGYCTVLFRAVVADKVATQALRGGNTDELYLKNGTREKSEMLARLHPDVARVSFRFNRWHHTVDYSPFKRNRPIYRKGITPSAGSDEHGLVLERNTEHGWVPVSRPRMLTRLEQVAIEAKAVAVKRAEEETP